MQTHTHTHSHVYFAASTCITKEKNITRVSLACLDFFFMWYIGILSIALIFHCTPWLVCCFSSIHSAQSLNLSGSLSVDESSGIQLERWGAQLCLGDNKQRSLDRTCKTDMIWRQPALCSISAFTLHLPYMVLNLLSELSGRESGLLSSFSGQELVYLQINL